MMMDESMDEHMRNISNSYLAPIATVSDSSIDFRIIREDDVISISSDDDDEELGDQYLFFPSTMTTQ